MNRQLNPLDITFDELEGVQCPNCGSYRVKDWGNNLGFNLFLIIATAGLWLIFMIFRFLFSTPKHEKEVRCKLCGYTWIHKMPLKN